MKYPSLRRDAWLLSMATAVLTLTCLFPPLSFGQIVRDGTLGPPGGPLTGPNYLIDSTSGVIKGSNLFHSFSEFNVHTLPSGTIESATITNSLPVPIQNILSRVTGNSPSAINGPVLSEIPGANFFFLNPAGIVFGPNASLSMSGSVHFTTAGYIRFFDGESSANFYANPVNDSLVNSILSLSPVSSFGFLTASPVAYGFLDGTAAAITVQGSQLSVASGQALSLIGGTVVVIGVAMIVLPGPAVVVIPAGLAILATEFSWARRALSRGRKQTPTP